MSNDDFTACCSELAKLVETEEGVKVRLVIFDAGLQHEEDVDSDDQDFRNLRAKARYGCGGTSFEEPVKYMSNTAEDKDWVSGAVRVELPMHPVDLGIIFTDGYAPMPSFKPNTPLIWCLTKDGREDSEMLQVVRMSS
jgi:predicted metal-dependent peptidase